MSSVHSRHMPTPTIFSLLRHTPKKSSSKPGGGGGGGGLFRMFKLLPMLSTGCKMAALLGSLHRKPLLTDKATTVTLFGYRKGRLSMAIQDDPHRPPVFVIELPMLTTSLHREMASDILRIALETDTKSHKRKLLEEFVWAVYCNGRKVGYSIRRKNMTEEEVHVMQLLRGVSMGAGVLPALSEKESTAEGELTYIRARFDRVVGSKNSESFYMINPEVINFDEFIGGLTGRSASRGSRGAERPLAWECEAAPGPNGMDVFEDRRELTVRRTVGKGGNGWHTRWMLLFQFSRFPTARPAVGKGTNGQAHRLIASVSN